MVVDHIENCPGYTIQPNRTGDTERFVASTEKAKALLNIEPTPLESGLPETIEWYRRHEKALSKIYQEI
jgi:nucleoside-diphosphate-sugar epimerase